MTDSTTSRDLSIRVLPSSTTAAAFLMGLVLITTNDCRVDALIIPQPPMAPMTAATSVVQRTSSQTQQPQQQQPQPKGGPPNFVMSREDVSRLLLDGTNADTRPYLGSYLPPKEAALQDKRLLECIRTSGPDFDQCFFFGTTDSMIDRMTTTTTTSSSSSSSRSSSADGGGNRNIDNRSDESKNTVASITEKKSEIDRSSGIGGGDSFGGNSGRQWMMPLPTTSSASIQSSSRTASNRIPTW
mmetsp:Transcript_60985/g.149321  ORF Transcript_60985/g.149321 Transcript_60985/m.149321 type:complete len:242 (+) Transcript_60985:229-954(+)|eukprot:CAMPEP_0113456958 /NCGR_PEP_ID=MMETSP0014_2-20120614/9157_1 /TAXON_ID=2857 /ORGANISM="Nitzschia sp." /LENGTH=241 /DNA_ID=CAMNT_0000348431 /DNA_START=129 /DNA_END=854 /DNA_ORIENTATION=- /assembly_acc=CAM_ASM_000159